MSLPPKTRRERRAYERAHRETKKFPRKRCLNDGKLFEQTRPNKRFCSKECKDQYRRHGSAFGPLRDTLTKLIDKRSKEEARRQIDRVIETLTLLDTRIAKVETQNADLLRGQNIHQEGITRIREQMKTMHPACAKCGGTGKFDGQFCGCEIGKLLRAMKTPKGRAAELRSANDVAAEITIPE